MHLERAAPSPGLHAEISQLRRTLARFRVQLGLERMVVFGLRGLVVSAVVLIGLSVGGWLLGEAAAESLSWIVPLPLFASVGLAVGRWPSKLQAALAADRRLALDERLATAVELAQRQRGGRFDGLQLRDAVDQARNARMRWLAFDRSVGREALVATALVLLSAASIVLPSLPRPGLLGLNESAPSADAVETSDALDRSVPPDVALAFQGLPDVQAIQQARVDADLASRVQQEQAEREALDTLAQALGAVSAGQPAADAINRGDFGAARQQLSNLGEEADQLSEAAKQQLSRALQQAANASVTNDRQLADRERQAGQALSRNNYIEQRQALRNLADQVERSGSRSASANQLARDVGQLQQQSAGQAQASRGQPANAAQHQLSNAQQPSSSGAGQAGQDAGQNGDGAAGQQGGPGVGTGTNTDVLGDRPQRLDTTGQSVNVPPRLGPGSGVRPTDGTEDQTGADPRAGARSVSELVQAQQTGQVVPEQNLVPGEQRPVVRGYFR